MAPAFDLILLTVANTVQQRYAEHELQRRRLQGLLPDACQTLVLPDPRGARVGSGGSTLLALQEIQRRQGGFAKRRVLVLHSGGDARRLPAYSARGKIWTTLDRGGVGPDRRPALMDILLGELSRLALPSAGGVVVASGDAALRLRGEAVTRHTAAGVAGADGFTARGATVLVFPAGLTRACRHGVFTVAANGRVERALQKPDRSAAREAGALRRDGRLLVDSGIFFFPPAACATLLHASAPMLPALRRGDAHLDLYGEIAAAMSADERIASFLQRFASGSDAQRTAHLRAFFLRARRIRLQALPLRAGRFLHVGSSREWVECVGSTDPERLFGQWLQARAEGAGRAASTPQVRATEGLAHALSLRAGVDSFAGLGTRAGVGTLAPGACVAAIPVGARDWCIAPHGIDDDCKTDAAAGGTIAGRPLSALPARTGMTARELWGSQPHTLWYARIHPAGDAARALAAARWMWSAAQAPAAWRRMRRFSFAQLMTAANADRMAQAVAHHDAHAEALRALAQARLAQEQGELRGAARGYACAWRASERAGVRSVAGIRPAQLRARALAAVGASVSSQPVWPPLVKHFAVRPDQAVWASSPVRIDLAGGWTDTPPLCNDHGGCVLNAAIALAGTHPVQAMVKVVEAPAVVIHSVDAGRTLLCHRSAQLLDHHDPHDWAALPKAALVLSGLVPREPGADLARHLQRAGGGLAITLFSAVPRGSGLGTSSILGATLLAALGRVAGRMPQARALAEQASVMEQLISTRGGWQDQVGGLVGGIKLVQTTPGLRQSPQIEHIAMPAPALRELTRRSVLLYTGKRRMARDILETVLLRYLVGEPAMERARVQLAEGARQMHRALCAGDLEAFAHRLEEYWTLKRVVDPASTNAEVEAVIAPVARHLRAWSLAGAGGGGFAFLLAHSAPAAERLRHTLEGSPPNPLSRVFPFEVDEGGLRLAIL